MKNSSTPSVLSNKELSVCKTIQHPSNSTIHEVDLDDPGFGQVLSDHMLSIAYNNGHWEQPEIIPFGDISCSPAMLTLHYGQTVFEGMKAFRTDEGKVQLFRPLDHLKRLNRSCQRMCIPDINPDLILQALRELIRQDKDWVPAKQGNSLYIRPLIFADNAALGVHPGDSYRFLIMTSPVGAYYEEGFDPVSLTTTDQYIRAAKGGSGHIKTACNYGPSLLPTQRAQEEGYTQVIWLDAKEHAYIEEVGTMNIFFKIDGQLITPPLEGSILGGITRDSVIKLARDWDVEVEARPIRIEEVFEASKDGTLEEVFGTGTAAVISPVGSVHHNGETIVTDENQIGPFAEKLYDTIMGIQYGHSEDVYNWMKPVE